MAAEYFLYTTLYNNTLVNRSKTSFAPLPPDTGEIFIDYFIPTNQPLFYYRESGGTIVYNNEEEIVEYLDSQASSPAPNDTVVLHQFTGYTASTNNIINYISGATDSYVSNFDTYTGTTAPLTFVNVSGDTMTGSLSTTSNLIAAGAVTGSTICGGVWVHSPFICGGNLVQSPIISGSSCITTPILIGTSSVSSPVILGSTCLCTPTVCVSSCLCSLGTTRLAGATTAASTLNVSGVTRFADTLYLHKTPTIAESTDYSLFWDPTTKEVQAKLISGGSTNYYYSERITLATTTSLTPVKYLGYTGTTMPAGIYQIDFTEQVGQATSNNCVFGRFTINNITQGSDFLLKMNVTNFTFTNTLSRDITLPAGTNCFDMYFWNGGGTACATFGSIRIRKV